MGIKSGIENPSAKNSAWWKNEARLKLLILLPPFQKDVADIRREFDIPADGLETNEAKVEWHNKLLENHDQMISSAKFKNKISPIIEKMVKPANLKEYFDLEKKKKELENSLPLNAFRIRVGELGKKYHLPSNFYFDPERDSTMPTFGLELYVRSNIVRAPSNNWSIKFDASGFQPEKNGSKLRGTARWVSLQTFGPLNKEEKKDAYAMLMSCQKKYFPKETILEQRTKKQFERDLNAFQEYCLQRSEYDHLPVNERPNSAAFGEELGQTSAALRQATRRMRALIKAWFDVDI